jgi:hypothetical protein
MDGMTPTAWAKLLDGKLFGLPLFVFAGHIIAALAAIALEPDKISHLHSPTTLRLPLCGYKAHDGNRTHDLFLTKEVLCRLSYVGIFINAF